MRSCVFYTNKVKNWFKPGSQRLDNKVLQIFSMTIWTLKLPIAGCLPIRTWTYILKRRYILKRHINYEVLNIYKYKKKHSYLYRRFSRLFYVYNKTIFPDSNYWFGWYDWLRRDNEVCKEFEMLVCVEEKNEYISELLPEK